MNEARDTPSTLNQDANPGHPQLLPSTISLIPIRHCNVPNETKPDAELT